MSVNADTFLLNSLRIQPEDRSLAPMLIAVIPIEFAGNLGKMIGQWALYEQHMGGLISAVRRANGRSGDEWQRLPYKKRSELLRQEWATLTEDVPELRDRVKTAIELAELSKSLRDGISHQRIEFAMGHAEGHFIRFLNADPKKQASKRYFAADFLKLSSDLAYATGQLEWLMEPDLYAQLPSHCRSILQRLRGEGLETPPSEQGR